VAATFGVTSQNLRGEGSRLGEPHRVRIIRLVRPLGGWDAGLWAFDSTLCILAVAPGAESVREMDKESIRGRGVALPFADHSRGHSLGFSSRPGMSGRLRGRSFAAVFCLIALFAWAAALLYNTALVRAFAFAVVETNKERALRSRDAERFAASACANLSWVMAH